MEELRSMGTDPGSIPTDIPVFHVPEHYFDQFPSRIMESIHASVMPAALQLDIRKEGPYEVPAPYFETLSDSILQKVKARDAVIYGAPSFKTLSATTSYQLPDHYFESLSQQITDRLGLNAANATEEIETISPLLAGLKAQASYETPAAYFNAADFSREVQQQSFEQKTVEHPAVKSIKWARWAAAAAVIFLFSISGFRFLNADLDKNPDAAFEKGISKISDARIKEWLSNNLDESDLTSLGDGLANSAKSNNTLDHLTKEQLEDVQSGVW